MMSKIGQQKHKQQKKNYTNIIDIKNLCLKGHRQESKDNPQNEKKIVVNYISCI